MAGCNLGYIELHEPCMRSPPPNGMDTRGQCIAKACYREGRDVAISETLCKT